MREKIGSSLMIVGVILMAIFGLDKSLYTLLPKAKIVIMLLGSMCLVWGYIIKHKNKKR